MGHIFISYSHKDKEYVHKLADALKEKGFDVWIDDRIDFGTEWPREVERRLDACDAFILVMSSHAYQSPWARREINRAIQKDKPIFPLLLEGEEIFLEVQNIQHVDVRGGRLLEEKFYAQLASLTPPAGKSEPIAPVAKMEKPAGHAEPTRSKQKMTPAIIVALIGAGATIIAGLLGFKPLIRWLERTPVPSPTETIAATFTPVPSHTQPPITFTPTATSYPTTYNDHGADMLLVPAGEFPLSDSNGGRINVYLDAFYIDKYEVTNALYNICAAAGACQPPKSRYSSTRSDYYGNSQYNDYPVIYVDWWMADTYCRWRGADGNTRLPTDAEWEKAARGTDGHTYPWGDILDCKYANYYRCVHDTSKVGSYESGKSPYGVYDLTGDVGEWVADWYDAGYYSTLSDGVRNPMGPPSGGMRLVRGGSWASYNMPDLGTTNRSWFSPASAMDQIGFRCSRSIP